MNRERKPGVGPIHGHGPLILALTLFNANLPSRADDAEMAAKSAKILETYCHSCHGKDGRSEGGFNTVLDIKKMVASKRVVPGDPVKSKLLKKIVGDEMPPEMDDADRSPSPKALPKPTPEEVATLTRWITAGAPEPTLATPKAKRAFLTDADVLKAISADLRAANVRNRPFHRYFTTTHLYNAGLSDEQLLAYRHGLSKLVNSLSWGRRVAKPAPIDTQQTIFRIDLRDLNWSEATWATILKYYPYGIAQGDAVARSVYEDTKSPLPYLRADWFVFAASKPPLYHEILRIPATVAELEKLLLVDVDNNLRNERIARAAFTGSGVSHNNRMIERHESTYGAYWKSYDFAGNIDRQNVLTHPLGPGDQARQFKHDGGEIIFSLPNGLQGYMLATADGKRIDKGPTNIVLDKEQPDSAVVNGVSCMNCHKYGMIEKSDQVRSLAEQPDVFAKAEAETIRALYPPKSEFDKLFKEDAGRFGKALEATGAPLSKTEPVFALARQFENELDRTLAASEAGLPLEEFLKRLRGSARLLDALASLLIPEGTVKRDTFVATFASTVSDFRLGRWIAPAAVVPPAGPPRNAVDPPLARKEPAPAPAPAVAKPGANLMAVRALVDRGLAYHAVQDPESATPEFEEAIRLDPSNAEAHAGRALNYFMRKDHEKGVAEAAEAIRLDPRSSLAHAARGFGLFRSDPAGALAEYDEAVRLDPNRPFAHMFRANIYFSRYWNNKQDGDLNLAINESTTAIHLDSKLARAYEIRGMARVFKGQIDQAMADYNTVLRLNPNNSFILPHRSWLWHLKKDYPRAIADCDLAIKRDPKYVFAYTRRAETFEAMGRKAKAKADQDEAERLRRE